VQRDCLSWGYFQGVPGKLKRCRCCLAERVCLCAGLAHLQFHNWPPPGFSDGLALLPISECGTRDCCQRRVNHRLHSHFGLSAALLRTSESFAEDVAHLPGKRVNQEFTALVQSEGPWRNSPYTSGMELKLKPSVPLLLFVVGGLCFLFWLFLLRHNILLVAGGIVWVAVYFYVLADNYKRRIPIPTRGGLVTYQKDPSWFKAAYGFMAFLGLFFLFIFLILNTLGTR
jgi:hypothetical protein